MSATLIVELAFSCLQLALYFNSICHNHDRIYAALQTALLEILHSTVDGPVSGCVQKIAAAELRGKLAVTPRLRMAAGLA